MKKIIYFIAAALLMMAYACKTTEANYRAAYEAAKAKQMTGDSVIDKGLTDQQRPIPYYINGDTLPVRSEYIGYTKDGGADSDRRVVKRYCVVVGQFKQVFNARSMRQRLMQHGYPRALVLHNSMKDYYVIANTTMDAHAATLMLDSVKADSSIVLRPPYPYILIPGHYGRR